MVISRHTSFKKKKKNRNELIQQALYQQVSELIRRKVSLSGVEVTLSSGLVSLSGEKSDLIRRELSLSGGDLSVSGGGAYPAKNVDFVCIFRVFRVSLSGEIKKKQRILSG